MVGLLVQNSERFRQYSTTKNDFENQKFAIFEEILNNFGMSDDDMI